MQAETLIALRKIFRNYPFCRTGTLKQTKRFPHKNCPLSKDTIEDLSTKGQFHG